MEKEIATLHRKVEAGIDFLLTQPVYDASKVEKFLERYNADHGKLKTPLLVGILPLYNFRHTQFLNHEVPGIQIPDDIQQRISRAGEHSAQEGVRIAVDLVEQLRPWADGVYLMPAFHRYDIAVQVIDQIK